MAFRHSALQAGSLSSHKGSDDVFMLTAGLLSTLLHLQVVKVYPNGKMSKHMGGLQVGDSLEIKGPISKLPYTPNMKENIGMVIAPCSFKLINIFKT